MINGNKKNTLESIKGKRRSFGGKLNGFVNNIERALETKHLRAYLKGNPTFNFKGQVFKVQEEWN